MMKLGRNEPCHCGSGKKYKACCLPSDSQAEQQKPTISYDLPLLVDGESCSECPEIKGTFYGVEEIVQDEITTTTNDVRHNLEGFTMEGILSRTTSNHDLARPEYAAKGFTWYIRLSPEAGGEVVAYFKDVKIALEAHRLMFDFELEVEADKDGPLSSAHLNELRRSLVLNNEWKLLASV
jgi:hypothetical protein